MHRHAAADSLRLPAAEAGIPAEAAEADIPLVAEADSRQAPEAGSRPGAPLTRVLRS